MRGLEGQEGQAPGCSLTSLTTIALVLPPPCQVSEHECSPLLCGRVEGPCGTKPILARSLLAQLKPARGVKYYGQSPAPGSRGFEAPLGPRNSTPRFSTASQGHLRSPERLSKLQNRLQEVGSAPVFVLNGAGKEGGPPRGPLTRPIFQERVPPVGSDPQAQLATPYSRDARDKDGVVGKREGEGEMTATTQQ